jgi:hypothetical protein
MTRPYPTGFERCTLAELLDDWAGGLRFGGLTLVPFGDPDDGTLIAAGHVEAEAMIAACREYQRFVDQGKPGRLQLAWQRANADWRFCRRAAGRKAALGRYRAARTVARSAWRRCWLAACPTTRLRWPGPDAVGLSLAAVVPGCSHEGDDEPDHPAGCNCEGPWIRIGRAFRAEDSAVAELVTVVDWRQASLR